MGIEKVRPFQTCLILLSDFHLQNGNIFAKSICATRKYNKIPWSFFKSSSHI